MNRITGITTGFLLGATLTLSSVIPAAADAANLLGVFGNWAAYSTGTGSGMTCYALSEPRASRPKGAKRGKIYLMISDWPGRRVKAEPQIVYGYPAKEGAVAGLGIGADKFTFFQKNNEKEGSAWLTSLNDNPRLVDAMRGGVTAVASGLSARGTKTSDTYSLSGFNDALAKVHATCNM